MIYLRHLSDPHWLALARILTLPIFLNHDWRECLGRMLQGTRILFCVPQLGSVSSTVIETKYEERNAVMHTAQAIPALAATKIRQALLLGSASLSVLESGVYGSFCSANLGTEIRIGRLPSKIGKSTALTLPAQSQATPDKNETSIAKP